MELLVGASLAVRRLLRLGHGLLLSLALGAYVVFGDIRGDSVVLPGLALALGALVLALRIRLRLRQTGGRTPLLIDVDIGVLLAVALEAALVRFDRGLDGRFSPAIYVLVALVAAFARPLAAIVVAAIVLGLEAALRFITLGQTDAAGLTTHACFVGAFSLLNLAML